MSEFYGASIPLTDYPLNSKGHSFTTVQACIDDLAGGGWVYVPSGTWSEAVTISDDDVVLFGAGWSSHISGAAIGTAITITGDRCTIRDLQVSTTGGGGNAYNGLTLSNSNFSKLIRVYISDSDQEGIWGGNDCLVLGCKFDSCDRQEININRPRNRIIANYINGEIKFDGQGDDSLVMGCYFATTLVIDADSENCVIDGNRVDTGITDNSGTSTVGDNDET